MEPGFNGVQLVGGEEFRQARIEGGGGGVFDDDLLFPVAYFDGGLFHLRADFRGKLLVEEEFLYYLVALFTGVERLQLHPVHACLHHRDGGQEIFRFLPELGRGLHNPWVGGIYGQCLFRLLGKPAGATSETGDGHLGALVHRRHGSPLQPVQGGEAVVFTGDAALSDSLPPLRL